VITAVVVNPGAFRSCRSACRKSSISCLQSWPFFLHASSE